MQRGVARVDPMEDLRAIEFGCANRTPRKVSISLEQLLDRTVIVVNDGCEDRVHSGSDWSTKAQLQAFRTYPCMVNFGKGGSRGIKERTRTFANENSIIYAIFVPYVPQIRSQ